MHVKAHLFRSATILFAAGLLLFPLAGWAQTTVIGAGYTTPQQTDASPGQLITIFAMVSGKQPAEPQTATLPLPTTLGGFSVLLRQTFIDPIQIPIFSVSDTLSCSKVAPVQCATVSQITVQIPYELIPNVPHLTLPQNFARLEISYGNNQTSSLFLNPIPDSMHVLSSCDLVSGMNQTVNCTPMVKHSDGTLVTAANPATAGETVTMSLLGLGQPNGTVVTGAAAPQVTPELDGMFISYDARVNASPSALVPTNAFPLTSAQLRPGAVGIYDVPFLVPALPPGVDACNGSVLSNLTVNIKRTTSFAGVAICVVPSGQ